jgi:hypothetical protein
MSMRNKNSKLQAPNSRETSSLKHRKVVAASGGTDESLRLGAWSFLGAWSLDFGVSQNG